VRSGRVGRDHGPIALPNLACPKIFFSENFLPKYKIRGQKSFLSGKFRGKIKNFEHSLSPLSEICSWMLVPNLSHDTAQLPVTSDGPAVIVESVTAAAAAAAAGCLSNHRQSNNGCL